MYKSWSGENCNCKICKYIHPVIVLSLFFFVSFLAVLLKVGFLHSFYKKLIKTSYLYEHTVTYRHDSILMFIAILFRSLQHAKTFVDIPEFLSISVITGDDLLPDLLLLLSNKSLYILELTVGYEPDLGSNAERQTKIQGLQLKNDYYEVNFVNLSISAWAYMTRALLTLLT